MAQDRICEGCGIPLEKNEQRLCALCAANRKTRFSQRNFDSAPEALQKKKVLVVDDDPTLRRMIISRLESKNYAVVSATEGAEAFQKIKDEKPQLMILDVLMPGMTGYDLIRKMKGLPARLRQIPVILVTGKESMKNFFESWEIFGMLIKPFDGAALVAKVEEAIGPSGANPGDAAGKGSASSKRLLFISHQSFVGEYMRNYFEPKSYQVAAETEPDQAVRRVGTSQVDFIFAHFYQDPAVMSMEGIYGRLQGMPDSKNIPFVIFCEREKLAEAVKTFRRNIPVIVYDSLENAVKKIEVFLRTGVIQ